MDTKELGQKMALQAKEDAKILLKNQIELLFESGIDVGLDEVKKLIPGGIDDALIDALAPQMKPLAKAFVLAAIEKL